MSTDVDMKSNSCRVGQGAGATDPPNPGNLGNVGLSLGLDNQFIARKGLDNQFIAHANPTYD